MSEIADEKREEIFLLVEKERKAKISWVASVVNVPEDDIFAAAYSMGLIIEGDMIMLPEEQNENVQQTPIIAQRVPQHHMMNEAFSGARAADEVPPHITQAAVAEILTAAVAAETVLSDKEPQVFKPGFTGAWRSGGACFAGLCGIDICGLICLAVLGMFTLAGIILGISVALMLIGLLIGWLFTIPIKMEVFNDRLEYSTWSGKKIIYYNQVVEVFAQKREQVTKKGYRVVSREDHSLVLNFMTLHGLVTIDLGKYDINDCYKIKNLIMLKIQATTVRNVIFRGFAPPQY
ncbi:MAG: hypothetical protein ACFFDW_16365 [Candidatus Thorarchaeota archaeon]